MLGTVYEPSPPHYQAMYFETRLQFLIALIWEYCR